MYIISLKVIVAFLKKEQKNILPYNLLVLFSISISDSFNRLQPSVPVTPIQGPIFLQNDSVPVLPLYTYPKLQNGTLMQIPVS